MPRASRYLARAGSVPGPAGSMSKVTKFSMSLLTQPAASCRTCRLSRLEMIGELMMLLRLASALASAETERARGDVGQLAPEMAPGERAFSCRRF